MTEYVDTYCSECDMEVHAYLHSQPAKLSVRGEEIDYDETVAICPTCGTVIGDARVESTNLEKAYETYRTLHGILSPKEIKVIRESYGLSLREFSKFLGFGEQTAYRYEHGDIPDQAHNNTMLSARGVEGARLLLLQNSSRLSSKSIAKVEQHIHNMADADAERLRPRLVLEQREADAPSAANGYRKLDLERVSTLVFELGSRCRDLYWTKLQKASFFADMVCYERNSCSLTGLSYAHAVYGPVIDRTDEMRYILVDRGTIGFREHGWGEILIPLRTGKQLFSTEELELVDEVASFVNTFNTANELSDFSHGLSYWHGNADGEIIEYTHNNGEIENAMIERMRSLQVV